MSVAAASAVGNFQKDRIFLRIMSEEETVLEMKGKGVIDVSPKKLGRSRERSERAGVV